MMGAIDNLNSPAADLPGQVSALARTVKDLANNNVQAPYSLTVGAGGITDNGPTVLNGGNTVTGGETVDTLTVTGSSTLHATSATTVNASGLITGTAGATISGGETVTGGLTVDTVSASSNVSGANGTFSGQVSSNGSPVKSQPSFGYHVATSYQAMWIDGATYQMGISASSEIVKTSLTPMTADDARKLLNLTPYWGRYVWDDAASPLKVFFLAADVQAAGFGPDVACVSADPVRMLMPDGSPVVDATGAECVVPAGEAYSINYSQLVVPLVAAWHDGAQQMQALQATVQDQAAQIATLEARLTAAGIA